MSSSSNMPTLRTLPAAGAFLALGCVGLISAPAQAAEDDATAASSTIVVTGQRETEVISAKAIAPVINTPRSIVVVDSQVIKETGSATLVDALRTVPGITFGAAEGGNPIGDRPFIRGFDSQGSTFVDGVRDIGAQTREVFAVEQIQIVRGSDSTLGGRGGAGGTLNIVSKLPKAGDFAALDVSYGTDDYKRVTGDTNYRLSEMVAVRLAAMWHDQEFANRDAIFARRWGIAPSITVGVGTPTRLTAAYYHLHQRELPDSGIPYLYTQINAPLGDTIVEPANRFTTIGGATGKVARDAFYGLKSRDFRKSDTDQFTLRVEHDFGGITLRNTARYGRNSQGYIYTQPDDNQGNVFGTNAANAATAGGLVWRRANTRYGTTESMVNQTDLFGKFATGSVEHSFAAGAEFALERADRGIYLAQGAAILATGSTISPRCTAAAIARFYCTNAFTPNPNDPWVSYLNDTSTMIVPVVKSGPETRIVSTGNTFGLYAFDSITFSDALILNLGARYDRFRSSVTPALAVGATGPRTKYSRSDGVFNYQIGIVFKPSANTSLYASYATAATPPNSLLGEGQELNAVGSTVNLGGTQTAFLIDVNSLKVERTKSYEAGGKTDLFNQQLSLSGAIFRTETTNARVIGEDGLPSFVGSRRIQGVELGVNGNIAPWWNVFGGYTYLDAVIQDGGFVSLTVAAVSGQLAKTVRVPSFATGRQFPQTARHSASLFTNFTFGKFQIGGGAYYVSRVFGGYADNRVATQNSAGVVTVTPATKIISRSIPGYVRLDATASLEFSKAVSLRVNVQNLTDKRYFTQAYQNHYATIAPGRSAFATLGLKF